MSAGNNQENFPAENGCASPPLAAVRLRLWPAIVIAVAHLAAAAAFELFASTNIQSAVALGGVPLIAGLLMMLWWLGASRAPWRDRLIGLAVFLAAVALVLYTQRSIAMGGMLLSIAAPAMTIGVAAVLAITFRVTWPVRRILLVLFLLGCAGFFCTMRVDSIGGDLKPVVSWRWSPAPEDLSQALPVPEARGRAELPSLTAAAEDWPAFCGAARDECRHGMTFSTDWSTPPRALWRRKIGPGWSSFIAVGGYLFTQEQRGENEMVTCYDAATGELVWQNSVMGRFEDAMGLGPPRNARVFRGHALYPRLYGHRAVPRRADRRSALATRAGQGRQSGRSDVWLLEFAAGCGGLRHRLRLRQPRQEPARLPPRHGRNRLARGGKDLGLQLAAPRRTGGRAADCHGERLRHPIGAARDRRGAVGRALEGQDQCALHPAARSGRAFGDLRRNGHDGLAASAHRAQ